MEQQRKDQYLKQFKQSKIDESILGDIAEKAEQQRRQQMAAVQEEKLRGLQQIDNEYQNIVQASSRSNSIP